MAPATGKEEAQEQKQPLLVPKQSGRNQKTLGRKAVRRTFKNTAQLAKLLPTGTVLTFQFFSPSFTNQGQCNARNRYMTGFLLAACGLLCFVLNFTDSFRDGAGKVRYGLATFKGLWVIDGSPPLPQEVASNYRIRFLDFIHALTAILVFAALVLLDQKVVSCFCPTPSEETKQLLVSLPIGIGVIGSLMFLIFPSTRHGVGFPLSRH